MKNPQVTIELETGEKIVLELFPEKAPNTVNNFISLAKKGFYNKKVFHRVIVDFMIQGGGYEGKTQISPGYSIKGEFRDNGFAQNDIPHKRGVLSMARLSETNNPSLSPYDTAGAQFFIMHTDKTHLDGQYAAFGQVLSGIETVDKIATAQTDYSDRPIEDVCIKAMTVDTFGVDYAQPVTIAE